MQKCIEDYKIREIDPNKDYLWKWIPSRGKSGGMLSGINLEYYDVGSFHEGKYCLQWNLWDKHKMTKWNFINVYGAAHEEDKDEFLAELVSFIRDCKEPVIIGEILVL
jgi:hypothetical protein